VTLNRAKGRMFKSVGWTWNPIAGCSHNCKYCWAESRMKRWGKTFKPQIREHFFKDKMPDDGTWIFVGSMGDAFCDGVPDEWIIKLLKYIRDCKADNNFLLQTKNPRRFSQTNILSNLQVIKDKVVLGTTLETTEETPWSTAPRPLSRAHNIAFMKQYEGFNTFLSLEPLADFKVDVMMHWIGEIRPEAIEIGLENYTSYTSKPPNWKIVALIQFLRDRGYTTILKENLDYLYPTLGGKETEDEK